MNYVVKADNPSVGFSVGIGEVKDSEGHVITDAQVNVEITSTDESVLGITLNADGRSGTASFGTIGNAAFVVNVKDANGNILATGGDNFTVVPGDPASVSGVSTAFDGLTPVTEEPPADTPPADAPPVEESPIS